MSPKKASNSKFKASFSGTVRRFQPNPWKSDYTGVNNKQTKSTVLNFGRWPDRWPSELFEDLPFVPNIVSFAGLDLESLLSRRLLGLVSSHPSRDAFRNPTWQAALDGLLLQAKRNSQIVLYPHSAPYASSIAFACNRYRIDAIALRLPQRKCAPKNLNPLTAEIVLELDLGCNRSKQTDFSEDLAVCILSDQVVGLHVSPRGKVASVLQRRLNCKTTSPSSVWIASSYDPSEKQAALQNGFAQQGAVLWFPEKTKQNNRSMFGCDQRPVPACQQVYAQIPEPLLDSNRYFIHTTRSRQSAWPDQSNSNLLDEVFRFAWNPNPTPLDTLLRILREQKLLASTLRKRGNLPTVSFTENPLGLLKEMRVFQSHLSRWDWEPYGIAVDRAKLLSLGTRPVHYCQDSEIEKLSVEEQVFCQPCSSDQGGRDWSYEREWRLPNDLRLALLRPDEAFVFVASQWEASYLVHYSRFPVFFLDRHGLGT